MTTGESYKRNSDPNVGGYSPMGQENVSGASNDKMLGTIVDGRYLLTSRIARGGMATVYLGLDRRLDRPVAVKIMHPHLAESSNFVARFHREARAAARLTHPGIVAVYDQGITGDDYYLVMEYVEGPTLRQLLKEQTALSLADSLEYMAQVLSALAAAHRSGVIHRDVKPENVIVPPDHYLKVADFGLARAAEEVTAATTGSVMGTVAYIAPEIVTSGKADARADVYAAGVMLYELITGVQPYSGDSAIQVAYQHVSSDIPVPSKLVPYVPRAVDDLITAFTARNPFDRPSNAGEALEMLFECQASLAPKLAARRFVSPNYVKKPLVVLPEPVLPTHDTTSSALNEVDVPVDTEFEPQALSADETTPDLPAPSPVRSANEEDNGTTGDTDGSGEVPWVDVNKEASPALMPVPVTTVPPAPFSGSVTDKIEMPLPNSTLSIAPVPGPQAHPMPSEDPLPFASVKVPTQLPPLPPKELVVAKKTKFPVWSKWLIGVLSLVAAIALGTVLYFKVGPGAYSDVPPVAGKSLAEATKLLEDAQLVTKTRSVFHDNVPEGHIVGSTPQAGASVEKDSTVTISISKGIEKLAVPALIGKTVEEAQAIMTEARMTIGSQDQDYSDTVPAGQIISINPEADTVIPHTQPVNILVSKGPAPVQIPEVTGKNQEQAQQVINSIGLKANLVQEFSDSVPKDQVIRQEPAAGQTGKRGDTITVVYSKGPEMVAVPNVIQRTAAEARQMLEAAGFTVKTDFVYSLFDRVAECTPAPGTKAKYGSVVTIRVV